MGRLIARSSGSFHLCDQQHCASAHFTAHQLCHESADQVARTSAQGARRCHQRISCAICYRFNQCFFKPLSSQIGVSIFNHCSVSNSAGDNCLQKPPEAPRGERSSAYEPNWHCCASCQMRLRQRKTMICETMPRLSRRQRFRNQHQTNNKSSQSVH